MLINIEHFAAKNILIFHIPPQDEEVGTVYVKQGQAAPFPLLQNILAIDGVVWILFGKGILALKYEQKANIDDLQALVLAEIDDEAENKQYNFGNITPYNLSDVIEAIADTLIRPTLYRDNGDIKIISCEKGNLLLRFTGHCAGCPYAQNTLNNVIIRTINKYLPQVKTVQMAEE